MCIGCSVVFSSQLQAHVLEHEWIRLGAPGTSTVQQEEHTGLLRIAQRHFRTAVLLLTSPSVLDEAAIDLLLRKASAVLLLARRCCLLGAVAF